MKKILLALVLTFALTGLASAQTAQGFSIVTGTTVSSTPVTIAIPPNSQYFIDFDVILSCSQAVTGQCIITSGGVTVYPHTMGKNSAVPAVISHGWFFDAPFLNNKIVLTDVQNIGITYTFRLWTGTSRNNRPE